MVGAGSPLHSAIATRRLVHANAPERTVPSGITNSVKKFIGLRLARASAGFPHPSRGWRVVPSQPAGEVVGTEVGMEGGMAPCGM